MSAFPWQEAPAADFAVVGDPVGHSRSPRMHQAAYAALGLRHRYVAIHVPTGELRQALDHLAKMGYRGVNATVPHKEAALAWSDDPDELGERVGAVNTLRLLDKAAINTDAPGFMDTLADLGVGPCEVLLLGAGGSARALAYALESGGYRVRIQNRTRERAERLVSELGLRAEVVETPDPRGAGLVLNTTSASLQSADLGIEWSRAEAGALAYDLMYAAEPTPFLQQAAGAGLRTCDGLPLLVAQGARSLEWWLGVSAPRSAMMEALR